MYNFIFTFDNFVQILMVVPLLCMAGITGVIGAGVIRNILKGDKHGS